MENNKTKKDVVKEFFEKVNGPIVLKEIGSNSMTTTKSNFSVLWRPNNYRRQIAVKEKDDSAIKNIKSAIGAIPNSHTKIISIKGYTPNITIQYGKNTLTGIYSQNKIGGVKEVFLIETLKWQDAQERIDQKKQEIEIRIDSALYKFINQFNIGIPLKTPIWSRYEDFIKGEEYIDKIPREVIIHDTYFKKVYGEGLEFKSSKVNEEPSVHMKNYLKNRAIEDIAPNIEKELNDSKLLIKGILDINASTSKLFNQFSNTFLPVFTEYSRDVRVHNKVLKGIDKSFHKFNRLLSEKQTKLGDF